MSALAPAERSELARLEGVIERGMQTFVDVGMALRTIRDRDLYRAEHATFEEYVKARWGWERAHAYRLIKSADVVVNLSPMGDTLPESERIARPLTALSAEKQPEAWRRAVETAPNGKVTAKHVAGVVEDMLDNEAADAALAEPGASTPWSAMTRIDDGRKAFRILAEMVSQFRATARATAGERHGAFLETARIEPHLRAIAKVLKESVPVEVCTGCSGKGCIRCKQSGVVPDALKETA